MKQELHDYLPSLEHWAKEYLNSPTPKAISLKMYVCTKTYKRKHTQCYRFVNKASLFVLKDDGIVGCQK